MTGSTLTALAAYPAPNPETGLISIHPLDAGYHVTCREAPNHAFCQARESRAARVFRAEYASILGKCSLS
ncbi:hypothetical protein ACFLV7_03940 [Chloroflexota bacterium]